MKAEDRTPDVYGPQVASLQSVFAIIHRIRHLFLLAFLGCLLALRTDHHGSRQDDQDRRFFFFGVLANDVQRAEGAEGAVHQVRNRQDDRKLSEPFWDRFDFVLVFVCLLAEANGPWELNGATKKPTLRDLG